MWMSWYTIGRHFCPISRVLRFGSDWIRSLAGFATLLHHFSGRTTSSVGCGFCTRCGAFLSRILESWLYYNGDNTCLRNTVREESAKGRTCVYIIHERKARSLSQERQSFYKLSSYLLLIFQAYVHKLCQLKNKQDCDTASWQAQRSCPRPWMRN